MAIIRLITDLLPVGIDGMPLPWPVPPETIPESGGPDTLNPLLNPDGTSAINPEWAEPRGYGVSPAGGGGAVLASEGAFGRQTRIVHERQRTRRVVLTWARASGVDVELVRRALQVCRGAAGSTRYRHPMLDPPGDVSTAPRIRFVPQTVRLRRSASGADAAMTIEYEYIE